MSVVSFFEKFLGLQQEKAKATIASYRELVAGIATGEEPNTAVVERLLAGAGKSVEDLKSDVVHYQRRMELKALVAALPGLEEERRQVDEQLAAAQRLLDAAETQYDETSAPLFARRQEIQEAIGSAGNASRELFRTCEDPDLLPELSDAQAESRQLEERLRVLVDHARYMEEKAQQFHERADREASTDDGAGLREFADRHRRDAEADRREVKRLEQLRTELNQRREQIEQRMQLA